MTNLIKSNGTIKHLNVRKEGPEDDKVLALDVKIGGAICGADLLRRLLGGDSDEIVRMAFWREDGSRLFFGLEPISSWACFEDCWVEISGVELAVARVHKFKAELKDEFRAALEFTITVKDPPENAAAILVELVSDVVNVEVVKAQGDLDLAPAESPKAEPVREEQLLLEVPRPALEYKPEPSDELLARARALVLEYNTASLTLLAANLEGATIVMIEVILLRLQEQGVVSAPNNEGLRTVLGEPDELFGAARRFVITTGRPLISAVQRELRVGYNRSARILEALEATGVVSPVLPDGKRVVLIVEESETAEEEA